MKTFTAPFAQTPDTWTAVATGAFTLTGTNSLADGAPTNTVLLGTAGTEGAIVTQIAVIPRATNTATMVALFVRRSTDATGARHLLQSVSLPAQTIGTTAAVSGVSFKIASESTPLRLGAGDELYVGLAVAQASGIAFTANAVQF